MYTCMYEYVYMFGSTQYSILFGGGTLKMNLLWYIQYLTREKPVPVVIVAPVEKNSTKSQLNTN